MPIADLTQTATLKTMVRLAAPTDEGLERAGQTSSAESFDGRDGYAPGFLPGWSIPLPLAAGTRAADMRELRRGGAGVELKYQHFSVVMSASRRLSMLTAVNIDGSASRRLPRTDAWNFDGRLNPEDQWGDELYRDNPLDRGHMVRREDPIWGDMASARQANIDTFHFTNSCPQMAGLNQKTWAGLENYILDHARTDHMKVSVFTGPFFTDKDMEYRGALIPLSFWKVVAVVAEGGRPSATAYKIDQVKELEELEFVYSAYKTYQISIKQVIDATGIDFSGLVQFDGFSHHEETTGTILSEQLDSLENVRI